MIIGLLSFPGGLFADTLRINLIELGDSENRIGRSGQPLCNIKFEVENHTDWLARQLSLGVSSNDASSGRRNFVHLDLRSVSPGSGGVYVAEARTTCDAYVGSFELDPAGSHTLYNCSLVNHTQGQCHDLISFADTRLNINEDLSTSEAFSQIIFGMTEAEILELYPALERTNRPDFSLPGQFVEMQWTDREDVNGTPTRQAFLFDRRTQTYAAHLLEIPRNGVRVPLGQSRDTCESIRQDFRLRFGNSTTETRYNSIFELWMGNGQRIEYHASKDANGTVIGCNFYRIDADSLEYFEEGRLALDAIFGFSDLEGIYVGDGGPDRCEIEQFDVNIGMVGMSDGYMSFAGLECEFSQTGRDNEGLEIWGNTRCYADAGAANFFVSLRVAGEDLVMQFQGEEPLMPLRRCWRRR